MKPRDEWGPADNLAELLMWFAGGSAVAAVLMGVLAVLDHFDLMPVIGGPVAREMTRNDVECDWPNRTITIKPGYYTGVPWDVCGWSRNGADTIYLDGNGSTISPAEMMSK